MAEEGRTGVVAEGEFVEALPNQHNASVYDFKFRDDAGNTIIVNNSGHLAYQMKEVNPGDYVRVTYKGKQEYKGRASHTFLVEKADDN